MTRYESILKQGFLTTDIIPSVAGMNGAITRCFLTMIDPTVAEYIYAWMRWQSDCVTSQGGKADRVDDTNNSEATRLLLARHQALLALDPKTWGRKRNDFAAYRAENSFDFKEMFAFVEGGLKLVAAARGVVAAWNFLCKEGQPTEAELGVFQHELKTAFEPLAHTEAMTFHQDRRLVFPGENALTEHSRHIIGMFLAWSMDEWAQLLAHVAFGMVNKRTNLKNHAIRCVALNEGFLRLADADFDVLYGVACASRRKRNLGTIAPLARIALKDAPLSGHAKAATALMSATMFVSDVQEGRQFFRDDCALIREYATTMKTIVSGSAGTEFNDGDLLTLKL